ncbi:MAG: moderate conductance mechanosensitive channel [Actinomycetota bacterium]|nr:moderate conductance mechanosensitive channel [Actinomycetota bacterium]
MPNGYLYNFFIRLGFTTFAAQTAELLILKPAKILLIVLLALIASRLAARLTRRFISSLASRTPVEVRSDRTPKRATAIASTAAGVAKVIVWAIAGPLVLSEFNLNLGPFIAGATVIGAALGFGAQTLVRDLLAGVMILTEDQYGVGDTIVVAGTSGTVEDVNLLRSRIRADDGKVWFIANGEIRTVANASLGWSRATVDLELPYETDLDAAVAAASSEAGAMAQEPEWTDAVLAPPEAYAADVKVGGVTVRVTAKTLPAVSAAVGRTLLERVARRIRRGGGGGSSGGGSDGGGSGGGGSGGGPSPAEPEVATAAGEPAAG